MTRPDLDAMCPVRIEVWDDDAKCSRMLHGTLKVPAEWIEKMPPLMMRDIAVGSAAALPPGSRWGNMGADET